MWRKIMVRIVLGAVGLIVVVVGLAFGLRAYMQHRNSAVLALRTYNAIDEGAYITIGGIPQWLQIRGEDRDNPILLFLHGGPGASTLPLSGGWRPREKYFTVVQWDERGTGQVIG
jgi:hypothetical protein